MVVISSLFKVIVIDIIDYLFFLILEAPPASFSKEDPYGAYGITATLLANCERFVKPLKGHRGRGVLVED